VDGESAAIEGMGAGLDEGCAVEQGQPIGNEGAGEVQDTGFDDAFSRVVVRRGGERQRPVSKLGEAAVACHRTGDRGGFIGLDRQGAALLSERPRSGVIPAVLQAHCATVETEGNVFAQQGHQAVDLAVLDLDFKGHRGAGEVGIAFFLVVVFQLRVVDLLAVDVQEIGSWGEFRCVGEDEVCGVGGGELGVGVVAGGVVDQSSDDRVGACVGEVERELSLELFLEGEFRGFDALVEEGVFDCAAEALHRSQGDACRPAFTHAQRIFKIFTAAFGGGRCEDYRLQI
jgi:hypothetical protein